MPNQVISKKEIAPSLYTLLSELIDYAGLFPPAALSMNESVKNFARYIKGEHSFMLGRFVLPLSRLNEFETEAKEFLNGSTVWRLSALCGASVEEMKTIEEFNLRYKDRAIIDAIETKANGAEEIEQVSATCGSGLSLVFCEIPIAEISLIEKIAQAGLKAKARTGGIKQDMFPTVEEIARFIFACHKANAPFKATAGLHHPIRCLKPLTYEADSERGVMHGFLNLFLAAAFIRNGLNEHEAVELLLDENVSSFALEENAIQWREVSVNSNELKDTRTNFALSFGSCSFEEPIEDLKELGLYPI